MKFNPISKILVSESGEIIKKLYCPIGVRVEDLDHDTHSRKSHCSNCDKAIVNISEFTEDEVMQLLERDSEACLLLNLDKTSVEIVTHEIG